MKKILLSRGQFTIVDDEDYEMINRYKWHATYYRGRYYAKRNFSGGRVYIVYSMARYIMNAIEGMCVDHINHDTLDNRKCNLRICTKQQNTWNSAKQKTSKNPYRGIRYNEKRKKWIARITINGKRCFLGRRSTPEEAFKLYRNVEQKHHGEYAYLNTIEEL